MTKSARTPTAGASASSSKTDTPAPGVKVTTEITPPPPTGGAASASAHTPARVRVRKPRSRKAAAPVAAAPASSTATASSGTPAPTAGSPAASASASASPPAPDTRNFWQRNRITILIGAAIIALIAWAIIIVYQGSKKPDQSIDASANTAPEQSAKLKEKLDDAAKEARKASAEAIEAKAKLEASESENASLAKRAKEAEAAKAAAEKAAALAKSEAESAAKSKAEAEAKAAAAAKSSATDEKIVVGLEKINTSIEKLGSDIGSKIEASQAALSGQIKQNSDDSKVLFERLLAESAKKGVAGYETVSLGGNQVQIQPTNRQNVFDIALAGQVRERWEKEPLGPMQPSKRYSADEVKSGRIVIKNVVGGIVEAGIVFKDGNPFKDNLQMLQPLPISPEDLGRAKYIMYISRKGSFEVWRKLSP